MDQREERRNKEPLEKCQNNVNLRIYINEDSEKRKENKRLRTLRRNGLDLVVLRCEKNNNYYYFA